MTKQGIIDMLWYLSFQFDGDKAVIDKHTIGTIADMLLAKIEQDKKEQAREIIMRFKSFLETQTKTIEELSKSKSRYAIPENCVECYEGSQENRIEELKRIAKEYGVGL